MQYGTLVNRPSIGAPIIAVVLDVKMIGKMRYARVADEFGCVYTTPLSGLTERSRKCVTVGENDREMAALRAAMASKDPIRAARIQVSEATDLAAGPFSICNCWPQV